MAAAMGDKNAVRAPERLKVELMRTLRVELNLPAVVARFRRVLLRGRHVPCPQFRLICRLGIEMVGIRRVSLPHLHARSGRLRNT